MSKAHLTLVMAVIVFFGGSLFGAKLLLTKADIVSGPTCESRTIAIGEDLTTNLVSVDIYNSSQRSGLANRVSIDLQRNGFLAGKIGNAKDVVPAGEDVKKVAILTADKSDPRVQLVTKQFKQDVTFIAPNKDLGSDVTVVIGDDYSKLAPKSDRKIKSDRTLELCLPFVPIS